LDWIEADSLGTFFQEIFFQKAKARVIYFSLKLMAKAVHPQFSTRTAGLICPPEIPAEIHVPRARAG
jgi:hypothetical protein